jgi:hypothetical protein
MSDSSPFAKNGQSPKQPVTGADEVISTFNVTATVEKKFSDWLNDDSRSQVVDLVLRHETAHLYQLTLDDVRGVCGTTEHALGRVERRNAERVRRTRNWYPSFAFTHIMHHYLEQRKELPTWQAIYEFLFHTDRGKELIGNETQQHKAKVLKDGVPERLASDALRWRFGNAYYSFLREVYTVVTLRSRGFDIRFHPLADALFRVDSWMGNAIISIWVANEDFRRDKGCEPRGRKDRAEDLLADASPPFNFVDVELDKATTWGRVHLPSSKALDDAEKRLATVRD